MSTTLAGVGCFFSLSLAGVANGVETGWAKEEVRAELGSAEGYRGLGAKSKVGG